LECARLAAAFDSTLARYSSFHIFIAPICASLQDTRATQLLNKLPPTNHSRSISPPANAKPFAPQPQSTSKRVVKIPNHLSETN
jgi:hypothetical protein